MAGPLKLIRDGLIAPGRAATWAACLLPLLAIAQNDVPQPADTALVLPPSVGDGPGAPRLAEPEPDRAATMEEVVVIGESEWRLPDLGSEWRQRQDDLRPGTDRIEVSFLPLYDPENADPTVDLFQRNSELHRVGFIELFRLRFGGDSRD